MKERSAIVPIHRLMIFVHLTEHGHILQVTNESEQSNGESTGSCTRSCFQHSRFFQGALLHFEAHLWDTLSDQDQDPCLQNHHASKERIF